jgi:hypothetical protein
VGGASDAARTLQLGHKDFSQLVLNGTGNVGIGTTSPTSYYADYDNLVIASAAHTGMTIVAGTTSKSSIAFADGTSGQTQYEGEIIYDHNTNLLRFGVGGSARMTIDADGLVMRDDLCWVRATSTSTTYQTADGIFPFGSEAGSTKGLASFNTSTYKFTAPVTGVYLSMYSGMTNNSSYTNKNASLYKNSSAYGHVLYTSSASGHHYNLGHQQLVELAAGDTLYWKNSGASTVLPLYINSNYTSWLIILMG